MNTSNGALIAKLAQQLYVCDLEAYSGTYILAEDGSVISKISGLVWFAAIADQCLYYSNQQDHDYLYCYHPETGQEQVIRQVSCGNLIAGAEGLFLRDEQSGQIKHLHLQSGKLTDIVKQACLSFVVEAQQLYCATEDGLLHYDLAQQQMVTLVNCSATGLLLHAGKLFFADKQENYAVCCFDLTNQQLTHLGRLQSQSFVVHGDYLYASDLNDSRAIIRLDLTSNAAIRFCGEPADRLHIVDQTLYFLNLLDYNAWYQMPLAGGRNKCLIPRPE